VIATFEPDVSDDERAALERSAETLKKARENIPAR
jgi:malate/lactate dehydrogenase